MSRLIEVCCGTLADVIEAREGGAHRVELCSALSLGGLTPSHATILQTMDACRDRLDVNVLIRPREGNFVYSSSEIDLMADDIRFCRAHGAFGVVLGALTPQGHVDLDACHKLMAHCDGMEVTFHRAFDQCSDLHAAVDAIADCGFRRILTSGAHATAIEGLSVLADVERYAAGRLIILPGSGINPDNISQLSASLSTREFHASASAAVSPINVYTNPGVSFGELESQRRTDRRIVSALVE